ncbi:MAG TPA: 2-amino-4-hydroxy-6-hydroxymethyldihydropteridine diphosphokinase [Lachnospiraceae bacterium]|nr:2-amino-4-hydroxy-6-hydroxymethyldihydropteridine diphosphokinase [Lachnospiraceae bacterium]
MDCIKIKNLEVFGRHGVSEEENRLGQKFSVSVQLYLDTRQAGLDDDLQKSVHYGEVCHFITNFMKERTYQLIESAAEYLAQELLLNFKHVKRLDLEVKKPWAPIGLPLEEVSVRIVRGWHTAYVALGSNVGECEEYLQSAVQSLEARTETSVERISKFMETKPYGYVEQDDFLNGMVELKTLLTPEELLNVLHEIEEAAGRERTVRWGPRTLDLDIILYDDLVLDSEQLVIPHMDMQNRDFVLVPLMELAPNLRHPILNKTIAQLKNELESKLK